MSTDLDVQVEEWELRYLQLEESLDKETEHEASFIARSIITTVGRLGSLQLLTDPIGQALYEHVQQELSNNAVQHRQDILLQKMAQTIPDTTGIVRPSPATHDVDAFFDEYPECMRLDWMGTSDEDELSTSSRSSSRSDEDPVQDVTPKEPVPKRPKQPLHPFPSQPSGDPVQRPASARGRLIHDSLPSTAPPVTMAPSRTNPYETVARSKAKSPPSSFQYTPPSQTETRPTSRDHPNGARSLPPLARNQNPFQKQPLQQQVYQRPLSRHNDPSIVPAGPPSRGTSQWNTNVSNNRDSWEDHTNHQQNPFLTAREVKQGMVGSDPYENVPDQRSWDTTASSGYANQYAPPTGPSTEVSRGGPSIPDSLRRKFQPPKRMAESESSSNNDSSSGRRRPSSVAPSKGGGVQSTRPSSASGKEEEEELPEELQHLEKELVRKIQNEIMESGETISFDDIAGLEDAKQTVQEVVCWPMKRPDLFTGLRRAPNGLLLYGPPGTGKTLIGKAIAHESGATFFSISSSSMTSKWIGEGEKLVKTLFAVAAYREPAVVFIDEIDSLLTQRKATENEASRRMKTEFLVQLDGTGTSGQGRVLVIGATNKPQELDEAARRRFTKRLYIPLPAEDDRRILLHVMLKKNNHQLTDQDIDCLANETVGFSGADLKSLCTDAAMGPIRQLGPRALDVHVNDVPAITFKHFKRSLKGTKPSVAPSDLVQYEEWDKIYGSKRATEDDDDDDDDDENH